MKIDEYNVDEEGDGTEARGITLPVMLAKAPSMKKHGSLTSKSAEPLDFEKVFLIGYNENISVEEDAGDK